MSYSILRSRSGGADLLIEDPDPQLMTPEARDEFRRRVERVNAQILKRRGGVPIDVSEIDEIFEEMRSERGSDSS